ncbi:putative odorant receptor 92a [Ostrinia nubilalis]|uniref:putative odorant receptor 92a n=1 Tax=Ostrinia nubilalis TaxID=29057 RepID=UPI003082598D
MPEKVYCALKKLTQIELDFLSILGSKLFLYPFIGRTKRVYACYMLVCLLLIVTAAQLLTALLVADVKEWIEIINVAPNLAVVLMALLKYTKVHVNRDLYKKIFEHFRDELWDVISDSVEHQNIVTQYAAKTKFISRFLIYYSIPLVIFVDSFPRIIMYLEREFLGSDDTEYLYPFDGWYPFDKVDWYYTVYLWESFMTMIVVVVYAFTNMIHSSYTLFICLELKILGSSIKNLVTSEDVANIVNRTKLQETHGDIKRKLKTIIIRHQLLAQIVSEFDIVQGDVTLANYLFGSVFLTLTIFSSTVVDNMYKSLRYFFMFCSLLIEVFFYCMIGQILTDDSDCLTDAIYSADWPYANTETKMALLIIMTRTQRPFKYTAKGYIAMNLNSFSGVCSMSYQFFNLLRTAYSQ